MDEESYEIDRMICEHDDGSIDCEVWYWEETPDGTVEQKAFFDDLDSVDVPSERTHFQDVKGTPQTTIEPDESISCTVAPLAIGDEIVESRVLSCREE